MTYNTDACEVAIRAALEIIDEQCNRKMVLHVSEITYDRLGWLGTKKDTLEDVIKKILAVCESKINKKPIEPRKIGDIKYPRGINVSVDTYNRFFIIASALEYPHDRSYKYRIDIKHKFTQFHADEILSRLLDCYEQIPEVKEQIRLAHDNANPKLGAESWYVTWQGHRPSGQTSMHIQEGTNERLMVLRMGEYTYTTVLELLLDCYEQRPEVKEQIRLARKIASGELSIRERKSTHSITVTMAIWDRLNWLGTTKDSIDDIVRRMLDACEKRVFEELKQRLSVKPDYETLIDVMRRQRYG